MIWDQDKHLTQSFRWVGIRIAKLEADAFSSQQMSSQWRCSLWTHLGFLPLTFHIFKDDHVTSTFTLSHLPVPTSTATTLVQAISPWDCVKVSNVSSSIFSDCDLCSDVTVLHRVPQSLLLTVWVKSKLERFVAFQSLTPPPKCQSRLCPSTLPRLLYNKMQ